MKNKYLLYLLLVLTLPVILTGCAGCGKKEAALIQEPDTAEAGPKAAETLRAVKVTPGTELTELEEGLSIVRFEGEDGFEEFLNRGGASSDKEVAEYLVARAAESGFKVLFGGNPFGCSTISAKNAEGGYLFGRNFDWKSGNALIVSVKPAQGYASVSTTNLDFIQAGGVDLKDLPDHVLAIAGIYVPLDGMNEKGLAVSVNVIEDSATIYQDTEKPDLTTTTAVRLLLNQAADTKEAVALLEQYDLHASMGKMVHFALADAEGNSVAVEYTDNEMKVAKTPVVTNFYLSEGEKYGIGSEQSHTRYEILMQALKEQETMTAPALRDALKSVSGEDVNEYESTEWSIVMNQETKELTYFHRENFEKGYTVSVE